MAANPARVICGEFPTPLAALPRLSAHLGGPRLLIKRDDLTGLATGGNKTRKLEYLIADALAQGADTVITMGAAQSNHARQTAAAAAKHGLASILVLAGGAPLYLTGNLLIDRLVGSTIYWAGDSDQHELMEELAKTERLAGRKPYVIPYGGSNAIGAAGYVTAMAEMARQVTDLNAGVDWIVVASSSGGTQAGMVAGARAYNFQGRILGISVDQEAGALTDKVLTLAQLTAGFMGMRFALSREAVLVNDDYIGAGYGVVTDAEREAIRLVARIEGLLLDPVYTAKAMAGLVDLVGKGFFGRDDTVLFWHTGGLPALWAYKDEI